MSEIALTQNATRLRMNVATQKRVIDLVPIGETFPIEIEIDESVSDGVIETVGAAPHNPDGTKRAREISITYEVCLESSA